VQVVSSGGSTPVGTPQRRKFLAADIQDFFVKRPSGKNTEYKCKKCEWKRLCSQRKALAHLARVDGVKDVQRMGCMRVSEWAGKWQMKPRHDCMYVCMLSARFVIVGSS